MWRCRGEAPDRLYGLPLNGKQVTGRVGLTETPAVACPASEAHSDEVRVTPLQVQASPWGPYGSPPVRSRPRAPHPPDHRVHRLLLHANEAVPVRRPADVAAGVGAGVQQHQFFDWRVGLALEDVGRLVWQGCRAGSLIRMAAVVAEPVPRLVPTSHSETGEGAAPSVLRWSITARMLHRTAAERRGLTVLSTQPGEACKCYLNNSK